MLLLHGGDHHPERVRVFCNASLDDTDGGGEEELLGSDGEPQPLSSALFGAVQVREARAIGQPPFTAGGSSGWSVRAELSGNWNLRRVSGSPGPDSAQPGQQRLSAHGLVSAHSTPSHGDLGAPVALPGETLSAQPPAPRRPRRWASPGSPRPPSPRPGHRAACTIPRSQPPTFLPRLQGAAGSLDIKLSC